MALAVPGLEFPSTSTQASDLAESLVSNANHVISNTNHVTVSAAEAIGSLTATGSPSKNYYSAEEFNFVMSGLVAPLLCIPGMAGNVLAVLVWNRPSMVSSTGRYLTAQAVSDFFVLFFYLFNDCVQAWEPQIVFGAPYAYYFSYVGFPLYFFFIILHVWFTVGVTLDLCIMVCWILKAKAFCNIKVANSFIIALTVIGFLVNIPHFFNFRPVPMTTNTTNTTNTTTNTTTVIPNHGDSLNHSERTLSFALTDFGSGDRGMYYEFCIHCVLLIMIPWTSVFAMNVKVIYKLIQSNKRMADKKSSQSVKNSKQTEAQITRLLLGVTFSFLVFVGINCAVHCPWMMKPPKVDRQLVISSFMFAKTGMVFNAASHFFFYCILGKRFRAELGLMLRLTPSGNRKSINYSIPRTKTPTTITTATTTSDNANPST